MFAVEKRRLGTLDCHVIDSVDPPELAAVFCHGFGAPGNDLVPIAEELRQLSPLVRDKVQFVFPIAPLSLAQHGIPGGRAWWMIDMDRLARASQLGEFRDLSREAPARLAEAREELGGVLTSIQDETGLPLSRIVLGGFSQGSMLATDVALHLEQPPAGLVVWSGTLLNAPVWSARMTRLADVPVIQSHGTDDWILPYEAALWLKDLMVSAGARHQFLEFPGGHGIPFEALQLTAHLLERLLHSGGELDNND